MPCLGDMEEGNFWKGNSQLWLYFHIWVLLKGKRDWLLGDGKHYDRGWRDGDEANVGTNIQIPRIHINARGTLQPACNFST